MLIQAFCQTFLIHRQGVNVNAVNAVSDVIQHFLFDPVAHIGNDNVGAGTFADRMHFHNKFRRADAAADQSRIEYDRFDKTIFGAAHNPVFFRLVDTAGRITSKINRQQFVVTIDQKHRNAGKNPLNQGIFVFNQINLAVRKAAL